ncbi:MAG TPA: excinuclease ABC subunit UvrC [Tissierellaceae bacterium]|nr:excinuclease ABC subunit UvrC [Tissierellaceae bacterium]
MFNIQEELKQLPDKPGVYIMKDKNEEIIYVGKAKILKNRVRQYFQSSKNQGLKVRNMVKYIDEFEYIIVDSEMEALILEANLIKKHRPKYNILLRDDKQYPYIKITLNEKYPRVIHTREILNDGARYFGPYPNGVAVNDAIDTLHYIYPIRRRKLKDEKNAKDFRATLDYHIRQKNQSYLGDLAKQDYINEDDYMDMINDIIRFLNGKDYSIVDYLQEKMEEASKKLEFEKASMYRDQINSLKGLQEKQKIVNSNMIDQDVIGMAKGIEEVCIQIFFIRDGKITGREHFLMEDTFNSDRREIVTSFLKQFYIGSAYVPREILIEEDIGDLEILEEWLGTKRGSKIDILVPKRGDKYHLIQMVNKNARDMLNKYGDKFLRKHRENLKALEEIQDILNLGEIPNRIEAYDISNISGVQSVGSMVVFEKGQAKRSDYRRFRIRSVHNPDDYGSMKEVVERRFKRGLKEKNALKYSTIEMKGFSSFPNLLMIDGGKGQVNIVIDTLSELGIDIPVCGLVKDELHKTRGIIYNNEEYILPIRSLGFRMIYKIQEEAHRFALSYHKSLRSKDMFQSQLDGIKGIGEKRKMYLMRHFKSIAKIKNASVQELVEVEGMNQKVAEELYNHFRENKEG